jgi:hypothetical protein
VDDGKLGGREERTYLAHAIGNSQLPGTDCTTIFDSLTPEASRVFFVPSRRGSMIAILSQRCLVG